MIDPSANLMFTVFDEPGAVVLAPTGEIDYFTSASFTERLAGMVELGRPTTVLDLTSVSFCDSAGIAALIGASRQAGHAAAAARPATGPSGVPCPSPGWTSRSPSIARRVRSAAEHASISECDVDHFHSYDVTRLDGPSPGYSST